MKKFFYLLVLVAIACSCVHVQQDPNKEQKSDQNTSITNSKEDGIFIHISNSYNDPQRLLMPLKMATIMATEHPVLIYMDIEAVKILVDSSEDITMDGFESAHVYIEELLKQNVMIMACPSCLKAAGYTPKDLMHGIQVAQKDQFFSFAKGRIITLDY